jgi:hypothetical protein
MAKTSTLRTNGELEMADDRPQMRSSSMSHLGHSLPSPPITPDTRCPLRPVNDRMRMAAQYVAKGHERTHAPQQTASLFDSLSARPSSEGGAARPSALALLRLTISFELRRRLHPIWVCPTKATDYRLSR